MILSFISRKIFLDYLGAEVLGLNTTIINILGFLNLAELGIGAAVAFSLYSPLYQNDRKVIYEIIYLQRYFYRIVSLIMIVVGIIITFFFHRIFAKVDLPLWYPIATFWVLLLGVIVNYLVNYKQVLLSADQKEYVITVNFQFFKVFKLVLQILAIKYYENGYVWWLLIEIVFSILTAISLNIVEGKIYPWLKRKEKLNIGYIKQKHNVVFIKTKQLFFHKMASFVLSQSSPIIIYAYTSLTIVAIYGNYLLITSGVTMLVNSIFNSVNSSIGNLVAEGQKNIILKTFYELLSSRFWFVSVISFAVYNYSNDFIRLWVGSGYVVENNTFILIVLIPFIHLVRSVVDSFIAAYGLFQDIWSPIIEASVCLFASIVLGYYWGLFGILTGSLISLLLVILIWKPYFLFTRGFKESYMLYYKKFIQYFIVSFFSFYLVIKIDILDSFHCSNYVSFMMFALLGTLFYAVILCVLYILIFPEYKRFVMRINHLLKK